MEVKGNLEVDGKIIEESVTSVSTSKTSTQSVNSTDETNITTLTAISIAAADGVRSFLIMYTICARSNGTGDDSIIVRLYKGINGTLSDTLLDTVVVGTDNNQSKRILSGHILFTPNAGDKIGLSIQFSAASSNNEVYGGDGNAIDSKHLSKVTIIPV